MPDYLIARRDRAGATDALLAAVAMLHEQAHDDLPMQVCGEEPCRDLVANGYVHSGPAPATMPRIF